MLAEIVVKAILTLRADTAWAKVLESLRRENAQGVKLYDEGGNENFAIDRIRFLGREYGDFRRTMPGQTMVDPIHAWLLPLNHWAVKIKFLTIAQYDPSAYARWDEDFISKSQERFDREAKVSKPMAILMHRVLPCVPRPRTRNHPASCCIVCSRKR